MGDIPVITGDHPQKQSESESDKAPTMLTLKVEKGIGSQECRWSLKARKDKEIDCHLPKVSTTH